ncbi:MAG: deoxyribodipyrimidine photo-lyase [Paenarthrobacter ureafaciens]|uniref:cryptochrome/photolyase family protein n=1 Tax=Paenarthrobacter ureafaciens TaxID=37931 RepID=UPI001ACFA4C6|nr:deoxyribodipyrimidine photo-lyase [Paenarthrobacter ureafaciens]MBN9131375.1 deoxyribodipyrimidine photo-lyase [Paenarthrobacter ureafaciens]
MKPSIVWFRDDLRVRDNPALRAAVDDGAAVALYVLDEESPGIRPHGGAAKWWLHHSLLALREDLDALGIPLLLRRGPAAEVVQKTTTAVGAGALFWNRRYGEVERTIDAGIKGWAVEAGLHVESFQATLLHEPWKVSTKTGTQYKVFTPFWKAVSAQEFREPLPLPARGHGFTGTLPRYDSLESWQLLPTKPDWSGGLAARWTPGSAAGHARLKEFVGNGLDSYSEGRNRPDTDGSSSLSPYLRWGELSPFEVWQAISSKRSESATIFASELGWREFCWHQYFHNPTLATANLRSEFDRFPWAWPGAAVGASAGASAGDDGRHPGHESAPEELRAWQKGRTGFPLVDAGQRQLWETGWMHNRVRMVAASFLVKNLGIHWQLGEQWFWDTLVDADPASNPANWQWVAGSGADASPFFRIFNPEAQRVRFDPQGKYIAQWIPEFGTPDYPAEIVDLKASRQDALDAYKELREVH